MNPLTSHALSPNNLPNVPKLRRETMTSLRFTAL